VHPSDEIQSIGKYQLYSLIKCTKCKTIYWLRDENKIGEDSLPDKYIKLGYNDYFTTEVYGKRIDEYMSVKKYIEMMDSELFHTNREEYLSTNEIIELLNLKLYDTDEEEFNIRLGLWWDFYDLTDDIEIFIEQYKTAYDINCIRLIELNKEYFVELFTWLGRLWERDECIGFLELNNDTEEFIWAREKIKKYAEENKE
jgi:hypothetical protein